MVAPVNLLRSGRRALLRRLPRSSPPAVEGFAQSTVVTPGPVRLPVPAPVTIVPPTFRDAFELVRPAKFRDWSPRVATVSDARLVGPSAGVLDASGRLIKQSLWDEDQFRRDFRRRLPADRRSVAGTMTSLPVLWDENYYHWLIDALPRLGVLASAGHDFRELAVVVPSPLRRFQSESLDALGIRPEHRIPYDGTSLRVEQLLWASPAAPIGFCSPFIPQWLREQFVTAPGPRSRRLFVARRVRRVANEAEISQVLTRHGFELIRPEELSFTEQVELFATAEMVVGTHGAGMANLAFGEDVRVLELFQPGYLNTGPFAVCQAAGHRYWAMVGDRVDRPGPAKDADVRLDPVRFEETIEEMVRTL